VTASYNTGTDTLTLTCANVGAQGKDWTVQVDQKALAAGLTATLTGSAALSGGRVRMGAAGTGAGTEDLTTLLTKLQSGRYARIASVSNDASNAALLEAHVNGKADMLKLLLEQVVFCHSGTVTQAKTLAQSTLNAPRAQVLWMKNADIHPAVLAAVKAAIRASTEGSDPVPDYDGLLLPGIPAHLSEDDVPIDSEQNTALNGGVTPITSINGEARVVRSITSYSLNGLAQDERTLDIGDAVMTDYATLDLKVFYETAFRPANKYVQADPREGELEPPAGVAFPKLWNNAVFARMQDWFSNGWIEDPADNPPQSQFNGAARAIESIVPLVVRRVQHQLRQIVRQTASNP
jgi:phage tail sheath gpL-like